MKAFVNSELEYYTFLVFLVILAILLFLLTTIATNLCCGICAHAYCFQNDSLFEIYNRQLCRHQKHQQQRQQHLLTGDRLEKVEQFEFKQRCDSPSLPVTNYYGILCSDINEVIAYDRVNHDLDECRMKSTFGSFKKDYCDIYSSLEKVTESRLQRETMAEFDEIEKVMSKSLIEINRIRESVCDCEETDKFISETDCIADDEADLEVKSIFEGDETLLKKNDCV